MTWPRCCGTLVPTPSSGTAVAGSSRCGPGGRGSRPGPDFTENCQALAAAIQRGRALVLTGSHNAANIARPAFVRPVADFFAGQGANAAS